MKKICTKCGKLSSLVLENMQTGEMELLDLCKDCMSYGEYKPITEQIVLSESLPD